MSQSDTEKVFLFVQQTDEGNTLADQLKNTFGITLLQNDITRLLEAKQKFVGAKVLQKERLELFQHDTSETIQEDSKKLLQLVLKDGLKKSGDLTALERSKIAQYVLDAFLKKETKLSPETLPFFQKTLLLGLKIHSPLSKTKQEKIVADIMDSLNLEDT